MVGPTFTALASLHTCGASLHSSGLRTAFLLLLLISATWLLGLMAVNSDVMAFHYLFAVFSCLQVRDHAEGVWELTSSPPLPVPKPGLLGQS